MVHFEKCLPIFKGDSVMAGEMRKHIMHLHTWCFFGVGQREDTQYKSSFCEGWNPLEMGPCMHFRSSKAPTRNTTRGERSRKKIMETMKMTKRNTKNEGRNKKWEHKFCIKFWVFSHMHSSKCYTVLDLFVTRRRKNT